ncbi:MAG: acyltransferase [Clostridia bacterium]|nr:acyltransferase [Clostridia bacterium]
MKKEKLYNVEFMRAVCAMGIVVFHLSCHVDGYFKLFFNSANAYWGDVVVVVFFMLSGGMLYLNNSSITSLKKFYYKRFKSVFPVFYLTYLIVFIIQAIQNGTVVKESAMPFSFLLTFIGMDGYLLYAVPNYYILGEWFLGALVILYALYPLLLWGLKKHPVITSSVIVLLYAWVIVHNVFEIRIMRNLFSNLLVFYFGMVVFRYKKLLSSVPCFLISAGLLLFFALVDLSVFDNLPVRDVITRIMGVSLFFCLYHIGELLTQPKPLKVFFEKFGSISYPIFLVQHVIILKVLSYHNPIGVKDYCAVLGVITVIVIVSAILIDLVSKPLLRSKPFKKLDGKMLDTNPIKI